MTRHAGWEGVEGIILDAVGTLIEPVPSVARAYAEAASRQGLAVELAEIKRRFGLHFRNDEVDEQRGPMVTDEGIEHRRWRRIVANVLPAVQLVVLGGLLIVAIIATNLIYSRTQR